MSCYKCGNECEEQIVGCCNDGDCPKHVEDMCEDCGTWYDDEEVWRCDYCAKQLDDNKTYTKIEKIDAQVEGYMSGYEDATGDTPSLEMLVNYLVKSFYPMGKDEALKRILIAFPFMGHEEEEDD